MFELGSKVVINDQVTDRGLKHLVGKEAEVIQITDENHRKVSLQTDKGLFTPYLNIQQLEEIK